MTYNITTQRPSKCKEGNLTTFFAWSIFQKIQTFKSVQKCMSVITKPDYLCIKVDWLFQEAFFTSRAGHESGQAISAVSFGGTFYITYLRLSKESKK